LTRSGQALVGAAGAVSAAWQPFTVNLSAQMGSKPNILWFVSEDNNPRIGAFGDQLAHTPTLDRLAREGVLYRNAYCTSPVCGPSRFAIITGMFAETAAPANRMGAWAELPSFIKGYPSYLRAAGYYCTNNAKKNYQSNLDYADFWDESSEKAHWRNRPKGKPFFAIFNTFTTHESCLFKPLQGRVKPEDVQVPAYLPDTPGVRQDLVTFYNAMEKMDGELAARLAELEADGVNEDTIVFLLLRQWWNNAARKALLLRWHALRTDYLFPEKVGAPCAGQGGDCGDSPCIFCGSGADAPLPAGPAHPKLHARKTFSRSRCCQAPEIRVWHAKSHG
jgi:hypothetical protein